MMKIYYKLWMITNKIYIIKLKDLIIIKVKNGFIYLIRIIGNGFLCLELQIKYGSSIILIQKMFIGVHKKVKVKKLKINQKFSQNILSFIF